MLSFDTKETLEEKRKWHEQITSSQPYQQSLNYMNNLIEDFHKGLYVTSLAYSREGSYEDSALQFGSADLFGSVISINIIMKELPLNTVKRELRYMLEATIKYAAVDKLCLGDSLEDKLEYLYRNIPRSSITPIDDIGLPKAVVTDTKELYSLLCQFVHPSKKQISEYKHQFEKGKLGFETHKELDSFNRLLFRTFDVILYIALYARGYYVMKDVFYILSDELEWKFHKGKHIKTLPNKYR